MGRVKQPKGDKGSLKWTQVFINEYPSMDLRDVVDYLYLLLAALSTFQLWFGKLKCSMVVFSRMQYFLSFIFSSIRTIPAFLPVCIA